MDAGEISQNSMKPSPSVIRPNTVMKIVASTIGIARMKTSMMKAITRRVSTPRNSSGCR